MAGTRRAALLFGVLAGLLLIVFYAISSPSQFPALYRQPIKVRLLAPPETRGYLTEFAQSFAATHAQLGEGTPIEVSLAFDFAVPSAKSLASGETKTTLWLSANAALIDYVNLFRHNLGASQRDCKQLFASPLVLAVPARRYGPTLSSEYEYDWLSLVSSSSGKGGQAGATSVSRYRFAHGIPEYSVSGLTALLQLAFFAAGSAEALTADAIMAGPVRARLSDFETLMSQYGTRERLLLSRSLASEAALQGTFVSEQQLIAFNAKRERHQSLLTAHYSTRGSLWQDYTVCLSEGDWVSAGQRAAAKMVVEALSTEAAQLAAERRGFRPSLHPLGHAGVFSAQMGVDPTRPSTSTPPPNGEVVQALLNAWPEIQHPAAALLVLDTSGSMEGAALRLAKGGLRQIAASMGPHDLKALFTFSSKPLVIVDFTEDSTPLFSAIDGAHSGGGSSLYDTIRQGIEHAAKPELDRYRKLIIVVTDGEDKNSDTSLPLLLDIVTERAASADVQMTIVGLRQGEENFDDLRAVARAARGTFVETTLADFDRDIEDVLSGL